MISKLGLDLTITCLAGLTSLSQNIYNNISYILSYDNENLKIKNFLYKNNFIEKIKVITKIITEINIIDKDTSLYYCIEDIVSILSTIDNELISINNKISYNDTLKFCKNWRSCKFENSINRLTSYNNILDQRIILLNQALTIYNLQKRLKE